VCRAQLPRDARFCPSCGTAAAAAPAFEERRTVTALFADIVGSTATAESLDVEDVRLRLLRFHGAVRVAIEQHGGVVEKFIGDAVVGLFGAEDAHEDDPVRAVRAALAARDAVATLNADEPWLDLHVRIGVSTGEALVAIGAGQPGSEAVVTGDVLNTTARIQSAAPVDGVLVGRRTYEAVNSAVELRARDPIQAKGKGEPVEAWEAVSVLGAPVVRSDAPFVGRTAELGRLESVWRAVTDDRRAQVVTLAATAGTGKTRLVVELLGRLQAEVLRGRCLAYGEGITYWPLVEAFTGVDVQGDESVDRARAALMGDEAITQGELHWGIRRALELQALRAPTVLVVEDVHWAEATLLDVLSSLAEIEAPLLVLATARPDEAGDLPGDVIELAPLGADDALELATRLLGEDASPDVRDTVVRRAGGNPLFLEETARSDLSGPLPSGVEALIGARLDRLSVGARRLLGAAATVGAVFWESALTQVAPQETVAELERLLDEGLVHRRTTSSLNEERELAFHHELYRDVAYARLPRGVRAEMHIACADWIEERPTALELVEIVASHLERACALVRESRQPPVEPPTERAVAALEASATRAELREGFDEAERYLARALDLLVGESVQRDALSVRRAGLAVSLGRLEEAAVALDALVADTGLGARSPNERARAFVWLANVHGKQSRPGEARACLDAAVTNDAELLARAAYERSVLMSSFEGEIEEALEELARGHARALEAGNDGLALEGRLRAGFHLFDLGRMDDAEDELRAVIDGAEELGRTRDASRARMELAFARRFQGATDEAEGLAREAHEPFVRTGDRYFIAQNLRLLSELAWDRGDDPAAAELAREALGAAVALASHTLVLEAQLALVEALVGSGSVEVAQSVAVSAREWLPEGDRGALLLVLRMDALIALAGDDLTKAQAASWRRVELADELGRLLDRVSARVHLADVLRRTGGDGVAEVLASARALAESAEAPWLARAVDAAEGGRTRIPI